MIEIRSHNEFENQKTWLSAEIGNRISVSPKLTKFGFIGLMNRTNTGAFTTAVGRAPTEEPIVRHIQPVKAIARGLMTNIGIKSSTPLQFLKDTIEIGKGIHIVKETIGPNAENPAEWMDALNMFLEKGVPPEKTFFFPTFRDLFDVAASWKRMWKWEWEDFPFDSLNKVWK